MPKERALRFTEEAIELAQAQGVDRNLVEATLKRVYDRPAGDIVTEYNQCALLLEAFGASQLLGDPSSAAQAEWDRVRLIPKEEWKRRHDAKRAAGIIS